MTVRAAGNVLDRGERVTLPPPAGSVPALMSLRGGLDLSHGAVDALHRLGCESKTLCPGHDISACDSPLYD